MGNRWLPHPQLAISISNARNVVVNLQQDQILPDIGTSNIGNKRNDTIVLGVIKTSLGNPINWSMKKMFVR